MRLTRQSRTIVPPGMVLVVLLLVQGLGNLCCGQKIQSSENAECAGDTVDRLGTAIAAQSRAFLREFAQAVRADDRKQVASMLQYPIDVHIEDKRFVVHNPQEFLRNYGRIVNHSVKSAILNEKSSRCLFPGPEGFMVGGGELWFKQVSSGVFKVTTFNLGDVLNGNRWK